MISQLAMFHDTFWVLLHEGPGSGDGRWSLNMFGWDIPALNGFQIVDIGKIMELSGRLSSKPDLIAGGHAVEQHGTKIYKYHKEAKNSLYGFA